jgi:hypothetical protein
MAIFKESGSNGKEWNLNEKYSNQDLSDQDFSRSDPSEFNETAIIGSSFFQTPIDGIEPPYMRFPNAIKDVRCIACNLDNVTPQAGLILDDDGWNQNTNRVVT